VDKAVRLSVVEREAIAHALRSWLGLVQCAVASGAKPTDSGRTQLEGWVAAGCRLLRRRDFRDLGDDGED
jgi:hypothetical protein